ncbi:MAG: protein kinase [Deltaproteobacteria bacterium]|nr:protein kinase [Deltaproteobacteria bacterium]
MESPVPFGRYLLLERVAVGGMAEVYKAKAFGVEGFERLVAIKRILPNMSEDADFIRMFIDEARIASHLTHQNIVQIYELGKHEGIYFIAMEYVGGRDLRLLLDLFKKNRRVMDEPMACFVLARLCEALDYAHRKRDPRGKDLGIIHRDVSPQNVLVSYEGEIKLCDFGIAKAIVQSTRTQVGVLKGKFAYMSPEQVRGRPIDRRSDLFALGVIFYEMLTGERLFLGDNDYATLQAVRNAKVTPLTQVNASLSPELEEIAMRLLAKEPEQRYTWATEVLEDLHAYFARNATFFHSHHLRQFMQETFAKEIDVENAKLDAFLELRHPGVSEEPSQLPEPEPVLPSVHDHQHQQIAAEGTVAQFGPEGTAEGEDSEPIAAESLLAPDGGDTGNLASRAPFDEATPDQDPYDERTPFEESRNLDATEPVAEATKAGVVLEASELEDLDSEQGAAALADRLEKFASLDHEGETLDVESQEAHRASKVVLEAERKKIVPIAKPNSAPASNVIVNLDSVAPAVPRARSTSFRASAKERDPSPARAPRTPDFEEFTDSPTINADSDSFGADGATIEGVTSGLLSDAQTMRPAEVAVPSVRRGDAIPVAEPSRSQERRSSLSRGGAPRVAVEISKGARPPSAVVEGSRAPSLVERGDGSRSPSLVERADASLAEPVASTTSAGAIVVAQDAARASLVTKLGMLAGALILVAGGMAAAVLALSEPMLLVDTSVAVPEIGLRVDGAEVVTAKPPIKRKIALGEHTVEVLVPGQPAHAQSVAITARRTYTLTVPVMETKTSTPSKGLP